MADDAIVGYERVVNEGACDLCQAASGQLYHSDDLMPIHDACACDVAPVLGSDPRARELARQPANFDFSGEQPANFRAVESPPPQPPWVGEGNRLYEQDVARGLGEQNYIPDLTNLSTPESSALDNYDNPNLYGVIQNALRDPEGLPQYVFDEFPERGFMWRADGAEMTFTQNEAQAVAAEAVRQTKWLERAITDRGVAPPDALYRVTGMDHFPTSVVSRLEAGESVLLKEPGFLATTPDLATAEWIGRSTVHGSPAVWDFKVSASARALAPEHGKVAVNEWLFRPGTTFRVTKTSEVRHGMQVYSVVIE